ncbi:MAG: NADH-ubiquinone oxidoreductase-F iron-sulfur binding region domain-containing protein [Candidatus Hodarchaeales archaeon]|jgi:NADH-quinone oxidoreductase subunit F
MNLPDTIQNTVLICKGTGCISSKSNEISEEFIEQVKNLNLESKVKVDFTGCHGFCAQGPIVIIEPEGFMYCQVEVPNVKQIATSHLKEGIPVEDYFYIDPKSKNRISKYKDIPFYSKQTRMILGNCGHINPEMIEEYIEKGGYSGLKRALQLQPEEIIKAVKDSGLRGRGGAGFSTGMKWQFCHDAPGSEKYIICNADEGDPGAFMDRSLLEADPHSVLEGMIIGAFAIGANHGIIYVRAEYPLAVSRFRLALDTAREKGFLGENILNSGFSLDVSVHEGAGAFVCGEETALMASIEGHRGNPRPRPPFPANSGLWGKPTNINNVKTWASAAWIFKHSWEEFHSIGVEHAPGTAIFSLTGKVNNLGLIEVPMGTPLREIVYEIGGGILDDRTFKAVQTGGPSGGCLPQSHLNSPVDYETMAASGSIMGSGGMIVLDDSNCMVKLAHYFLTFTQAESCGKCIPCRIGTRAMLLILDRIINGKGEAEDLMLLEELAHTVKMGSLCALGQTAPNPVLTTLKYFRDEYIAHIEEKRCPAKDCQELVNYVISESLCSGCMLCARNCPVKAITGEKGQVHFIDIVDCVKCGICYSSCPQIAIYKEDRDIQQVI